MFNSGGFRGGARAPVILGQKEEISEGRKAGRASKTKLPFPPPPLPSLAQGLDPSMFYKLRRFIVFLKKI